MFNSTGTTTPIFISRLTLQLVPLVCIGIYISNRAQMDTKIARAAVEYASSQAAAGTSRLLLTATSAAR